MDEGMSGLIQWFSGGSTPYMAGAGCMRNDWLWIGIVIALCLLVMIGYIVIAFHWMQCSKFAKDSVAKKALVDLCWIFLLCGFCGYGFVIMRFWYPGWRLYCFVMLALAVFTWRYALTCWRLRVVYEQLRIAETLQHEVDIRDEWLADARKQLTEALKIRADVGGGKP